MSHIHINFEHVNYSYEKSVPILQDITFTAHENDSIGLIGANGVGKSTLLKLLVGLNPDYEGSIRVEEMPVVKEMLPKVREKIGYVFQDSDSQLFMSTVFEDVAFAPRNYGLPETEVEQRVSHALEQIHIGHLRDKQIYKLSGGEKKMASIATILAMTPDIILMDEPSMGLSPIFVNEIFDIIKEVSAGGTTVLLVEQNAKKALGIADRAYVLETGNIVLTGEAKALMNDESIKKAYLGE